MRNLGNLEGTLREPWEPSEPCEPLLGNLYLGTFSWEPLLGNLYLEPGNLGGMGFGAAPVCSETFTMAEDPKASAVGEKGRKTEENEGKSLKTRRRKLQEGNF